MCSNYANHPWFNGQHDWGDIYDQLMATRMFTLIMDKISISALKIEGGDYNLDLDLLTILY